MVVWSSKKASSVIFKLIYTYYKYLLFYVSIYL